MMIITYDRHIKLLSWQKKEQLHREKNKPAVTFGSGYIAYYKKGNFYKYKFPGVKEMRFK